MTDQPTGPALDAEVAERVMGWPVVTDMITTQWLEHPGVVRHGIALKCERYAWSQWRPSMEIADAFEVVEAMRREGLWFNLVSFDDMWEVTAIRNGVSFRGESSSLPEAICRAALKAKEER